MLLNDHWLVIISLSVIVIMAIWFGWEFIVICSNVLSHDNVDFYNYGFQTISKFKFMFSIS